MAKVITFANQKGGVGKTTTAHIVAVGLQLRGYNVLAIDLDPQANLTSVLGVNPDDDTIVTIADYFDGECDFSDTIVETESGVHLVVGSLMLSGADRKYASTGYEYKVKEGISQVTRKYDFIIIDTPPELGIMSLNALAATNYLVVVMTPDYFSGKGLGQLQDTVNTVKKYLGNKNLKINGLLLTKVDRTNLTGMVNEDMEQKVRELKTKIYESTIRQAVAIRESQYLEASVYDLRSSLVRRDYEAFIEEILKDLKK